MGFLDKPRGGDGAGAPRIGFEVLGREAREAVHRSTLEILAGVGVAVGSAEAREMLAVGGCRAEAGSDVVRFPGEVVESALETAPGEILLAGRDPKDDYVMGGRRVGYTNFGEGTQVYDLDTGELRDSSVADVGLCARLCDAMDMVATHERAVAPNDCPEDAHDVYALEACLRNTTKHIHIGANDGRHARWLFEIASAVQGGAERLRERPILSVNTCPTSPLQLHANTAEIIMECARAGVAVNILSMAMAGATAPISLSGALVTHNAEVLAGIVLAQATAPGAPVIYGSSTTTFDLKLATAPVGAPELGLISAGVAEMSDYYYLPCWVAGG